MIIIEGVDNAGKTTLADKLAKDFDLPVKHFGIPDGDPCPIYMAEIKTEKNLYIYDRFLYGEIPYSIVKKRTRYMKGKEFNELEDTLLQRPHLVIYVRPRRETVANRFEERVDTYVTKEEMYKLFDEYDELFECSKSNLVVFTGDQDYPLIRDRVDEIIEQYV